MAASDLALMTFEEARLAIEIVTAGGTVGVILWRLSSAVTKFELIGKHQAEEIREIKNAIREIKTVVVEQSKQSVRLDSQGDRMNAMDKRFDDMFRLYDELRRGIGVIRPQ